MSISYSAPLIQVDDQPRRGLLHLHAAKPNRRLNAGTFVAPDAEVQTIVLLSL